MVSYDSVCQAYFTFLKGWSVRTNIKALRQEHGISQAELADQVGVSRQTIISIENGRYIASLPLAYRIARYFGKAIEDVFCLADEEA